MERRRFLQTASGLALLSAVPAGQLLAEEAECAVKDEELSPEDVQAKMQEILSKYGGEFGGIKPAAGEVR